MNILKNLFKGLFKQELDAVKKEIEFREAQLIEKQNEIRMLKEAESSIRQAHDNCIKSIEIKDKELNRKDEEICKLKDSENRMRQTSNSLINELEEMEKLVGKLKQTETSLISTNKNNLNVIADKEKEINSLKKLVDSLRQGSIILNENIKKKNKENEILYENQNLLKESVDSANQKRKELLAKVEELENLNHEKSEENIMLSSQIQSITNNYYSTIEELKIAKEQIDALSQSNEDNLIENNRFKKQLEEIKNDRAGLISANEDLKEKIHEIEEKMKVELIKSKNLQLHISKLEKILAERSEYIEQLVIKLQQYETSSQNDDNNDNEAADRCNVVVDDVGIENDDVNSSNSGKERIKNNSEIDNKNPDPDNKNRIQRYPYRQKPTASVFELQTKDFPPIENENVNHYTCRTINCVFNHRSNSMVIANDIFMTKSAEEISKIRIDLEDAMRNGIPYLTCISCGNPVKISSRHVGFGEFRREVQFFTHAMRNVACDLKQTSSEISLSDGDYHKYDSEALREFRSKLTNALSMMVSKNKGISNVKENDYVKSEENPLMKRRLADVTAKYNNHDLVFEIVTPITNIARFRDKEIFYYLNKKQVFWIFGLESISDYSELTRAISKDILYVYKRNIFMFDSEAQLESKLRGELMLKCNWLDENGEWYYQKDKQGKNGLLISLDQIVYDDNYHPYYFDADEAYYCNNPAETEPTLASIQDLNRKISESYAYELQREAALNEMQNNNCSVRAYFNGFNWGFKYRDVIFIEPTFDFVTEIYNNYAKVEKQHKYGVVDRYGNIQLQPEHDMVELLHNNRILYSINGHWFLFGVIEPVAKYYPNDRINFITNSKEDGIYFLKIIHEPKSGLPIDEYYFIDSMILKKDRDAVKWRLWPSGDEVELDQLLDELKLTPELDFMRKSTDSTLHFDEEDTEISKSKLTKSKNFSSKTKNSPKKGNNENQKEQRVRTNYNPIESSKRNKKEISDMKTKFHSPKISADRDENYKLGHRYIMTIIEIKRTKGNFIDHIVVRDERGRDLRIIVSPFNKEYSLRNVWCNQQVTLIKIGYSHIQNRTIWHLSLH